MGGIGGVEGGGGLFEEGEGPRLFKGGGYLKYLHQREAINQIEYMKHLIH